MNDAKFDVLKPEEIIQAEIIWFWVWEHCSMKWDIWWILTLCGKAPTYYRIVRTIKSECWNPNIFARGKKDIQKVIKLATDIGNMNWFNYNLSEFIWNRKVMALFYFNVFRRWILICSGLINCISTQYGLFNAEIIHLTLFRFLTVYRLYMSHSVQKSDSFGLV